MDSPTQPRRHRWWTYSLRTFLIVLLLIGVALGLFGMKLDRARRQKAAVAALREAGVEVTYDFASEDPNAAEPGPAWVREWFGIDAVADVTGATFADQTKAVSIGRGPAPLADFEMDVSDETLRHLSSLKRLEGLMIVGHLDDSSKVSDDGWACIGRLTNLRSLVIQDVNIDRALLQEIGRLRNLETLWVGSDLELHLVSGEPVEIDEDALEHLATLRALQSLNLSGTDIRGHGLKHLEGLPNLRHVDLGRTPVADEALAQLARVSSLERLELWGTSVTDADMAHVGNMAQLRELDISLTKVTDDGLAHLANLKRLKVLKLDNTTVTSAGLRSLSNLPELANLSICETKVDDITPLTSMPALKQVETWGATISQEDQEWVDAINFVPTGPNPPKFNVEP